MSVWQLETSGDHTKWTLRNCRPLNRNPVYVTLILKILDFVIIRGVT